jgi:hypothetical protein
MKISNKGKPHILIGDSNWSFLSFDLKSWPGECMSSTLEFHCFKTYGQQPITPIIINKNYFIFSTYIRIWQHLWNAKLPTIKISHLHRWNSPELFWRIYSLLPLLLISLFLPFFLLISSSFPPFTYCSRLFWSLYTAKVFSIFITILSQYYCRRFLSSQIGLLFLLPLMAVYPQVSWSS